MTVIVVIAGNLAALRFTLPRLPNFGLVMMILVLEGGLFRLASRRGASRAFWLGFEVAGWAYVVTCSMSAWTAWRLSRSLFEGYVIGKPISLPFEMNQFPLPSSLCRAVAITSFQRLRSAVVICRTLESLAHSRLMIISSSLIWVTTACRAPADFTALTVT
jgi:hypothetical protein